MGTAGFIEVADAKLELLAMACWLDIDSECRVLTCAREALTTSPYSAQAANTRHDESWLWRPDPAAALGSVTSASPRLSSSDHLPSADADFDVVAPGAGQSRVARQQRAVRPVCRTTYATGQPV